MNRRALIRFQLLALAVLTVLLLSRVTRGPQRPGGILVFTDLAPHALQHEAFVLERPATVAVEAAGSFEPARTGQPALAAYGWMIRRDTREVVWRMEPAGVQPGSGSRTLVHAQDTLSLAAGVYDAYFAAYGNAFHSRHARSFWRRFFDPEQHWQNDRRSWMMAIRAVGGRPQAVRRLAGEAAEERAPQPAGLIWSAAPMRSEQQAEHLFEVQRPLRVAVYALGELNGQPKDYGWIEEVASGERHWEMTAQNTEPAGGIPVNRRFQGTLQLAPGVYRAFCATDPAHAFHDWRANPPYDPAGWGLTLAAADAASGRFVRPFDPWTTRQPIMSITRVPNDELRSVQFVLDRTLSAVAYGMGEISSGGQFDYAWIKNDHTEERVWEMTREASRPAGGDRNNRVEMAFLELAPGTYTLYYQTDGSHAYGDWRNGEPDHPERWGVTLFPLDPSFDASTVNLLRQVRVPNASSQRSAVPAVPPAPPAAALPPVGTGEVLIEQTRLGNEAQVDVPFSLREPTTLRIHAVGEITLRGRYDYGWIERRDSGERVWEMTWQNTQPAGGDDRNRRFDGLLTLEPGTYVASFRTDLSHAYGDFGEYIPEDPEAWGFVIERIGE